MQTTNYKKDSFKLLIGWGSCLVLRLIPFRAPNIEPIMATLMPFSKKYGLLESFFFGFASIFVYDIFTSGIGQWTWVTAFTYGAVGLWATLFFQKRAGTALNFGKFAIIATLVYDLITGVIMGPLLTHQSFAAAAMGQIPFTFLHLFGNLTLALVVSPLLYRWVMENPQLETDVLFRRFAK